MNTILTSVTSEKQKVKVGWGKWNKVYFAAEPNSPIIETLDIPGAWAKYLCVEVGAFLFSAKFCLLAIR